MACNPYCPITFQKWTWSRISEHSFPTKVPALSIIIKNIFFLPNWSSKDWCHCLKWHFFACCCERAVFKFNNPCISQSDVTLFSGQYELFSGLVSFPWMDLGFFRVRKGSHDPVEKPLYWELGKGNLKPPVAPISCVILGQFLILSEPCFFWSGKWVQSTCWLRKVVWGHTTCLICIA